MSTSKHINKICIAALAVTLVITILFMCGESLGLTIASKAVKYESTIFDTSYVHKIDIVMDDWDSFIETCENEEYGTCTVVVDGKKHANIAIRAKGNTSLSSVKSSGSQRYSFKLEFDHYEDTKSLDGLDKLCLNNLIQDNTMMKDYIAYVLMNDFGADSPLCSFAYITVNGEDWGLYLAVEGIEDSFLSRNYGSEAGDLYKPDSMSFGGGRGNGKDFNMDDFDFGNSDSESGDTSGKSTSEESARGESGGAGSQSASSNMNNTAFSPSGMPEGMTPPNGMSPPDGFEMPEGMSPPDGFEMPEGMTPPGGFPSDGQIPSFPGSDDSAQDNSESGEISGFDPGNIPSFPDSEDEVSSSSSASSSDNSGKSKRSGMPGFGGGMGSDDVKLKYIDDDPDSYSNIFDNAKTDVSKADKKRMIESLEKLSTYTDLEDILDTDEVLRYFVVHNFVCNGDSYTGMMIHNYYLHESDGKLAMIPWDYNLAFGTFQGGDASGTVNTSIDSPISMGNLDDRPMLGWIFSDETYTEKYHELFSEFIEKWFTDGELEKLISDTADMIRPYVEKDPTKFCTAEDFEKGVETMKEFVSLRGEAVRRQLNGDDTAVETGSLNLSDMGSMGGGMGKGGFSGNFSITSMIKLTASDGTEISLSDLVEDTSEIKEITLSDGTAVDVSSGDMKELMKTDFSKAVSVTDKSGKTTDLTEYTVSVSMPSGMSRGSRPGENTDKSDSGSQSEAGSFPSMPGGNSQTDNKDRSSDDENSKTPDSSGSFTPPGNFSFPSGDSQSDSEDQSESGESRKAPGSDSSFSPPADFPGSADSGSSTVTFIILVLASVAALAIGIIIAVKKKY